jgi:hypothetical protein
MMVEAFRTLISPEYLVVDQSGPLGRAWLLYGLAAALFASGIVGALWVLVRPTSRTRAQAVRAWAQFEFLLCGAGLCTVVGRILGWPGWSARIWPLTLAALAIVGLVAYVLRRVELPPRFDSQLRVLALSPLPQHETGEQAPKTLTPHFLLDLSIHLAGITLVLSARYGLPAWAAPLVLLALLAPQVPSIARRQPNTAALSPLLVAYGATLVWLLYRGLGITVIGWQGNAFPNPMVSLFYVDAIVAATAVYALLCQAGIMSRAQSRPALLWRWPVVGLLVATAVWSGVVYLGKRTHGATASDPYAYAQMAVDLADRGTFQHRFSLFQEVGPLDISGTPLLPVGYHIPRNELGDSPSVWATGASVLLAAGYRVLGETGLYVTTPIVALLALVVTWALVQELLRDEAEPVRLLTGAITVALLATSPEHVDRLLVPMADAAAQLFTILTLLFTLRAMRLIEGRRRQAAASLIIAGASFACAYWVRHTQLVLALPIALALLLPMRRRKASALKVAWPLALVFAVSLIAAIPDITYRVRVFGGLLATETSELPSMHLRYAGPVAWETLRSSLVAGEWGFLFPFALYGGYLLARWHPRATAVLGSAFFAILLVHLPYRFLRLRDLLSAFPLFDLAVAYGAVMLVRRARNLGRQPRCHARLGRGLLPVAVISWVVLSLALARWAMLDDLWKPGWASFGFVRAEQRAAFDRMSALTPPEGIVGASLNAGAVTMYTGRDTVRPYDTWTEKDWLTFLEAMQARHRPVYLLDDGNLMSDFIDKQRVRLRVTPIEELEIPLFDDKLRDKGWLFRVEWDQ